MMKKYILLFFTINIFCFGANLDLIKKIENKIYEKEINVQDIKMEDFCLFLSKEADEVIIPSMTIKDEKVSLNIEKNKSLMDIISLCCYKNKYNLKDRSNFLYIEKENEKEEKKGKIIGRIVDIDNGREVSNASLKILGDETKEYFTNEDGVFYIEDLYYDAYFLRIKKEGYKTEGELVVLDNKYREIDIFMEKEKEFNSYKETEINDKFSIEKVKISWLPNIDIEKMLGKNLLNDITLTKNIEQNLVYISGRASRVKIVKEYLENLDYSNKQVKITAQIIDVTDNLFEKLGFSWMYDNNNTKEEEGIKIGILNDVKMLGVGDTISSALNLIQKFSDKEFLKLSFNLLEGTQDLKIDATPSIVTVNGKEGEIKILEERIIGQEKTETEDNGKIDYTPIFKEAGIILKVIPEIMGDNNINLVVELESSDFKLSDYDGNSTEQTGYSSKGGSKISRKLKTTLKLREGEEVIIGGLKREIMKKIENRVPFLSSIPGIGKLFRGTSTTKEIVDLYIKLKIEIV